MAGWTDAFFSLLGDALDIFHRISSAAQIPKISLWALTSAISVWTATVG